MKKNLLLIFSGILFYSISQAQFIIKNYPIDQFKLPDIDRHALELIGSLNSDYQTRSNTNSDETYTTSQFNPRASVFYSRYINLAHLQADYFLNLTPDLFMGSSKNEFSGDKSRYTSLRPQITFGGVKRNYHDQHFTSIGASGSFRYNQNYQTSSINGVDRKTRLLNLDTDIALPLGIGTGRLENVSDMAMALFLINDAMNAGIDAALISPDQVNAFASKMVTLRNERVFDDRIKRIHELRELYSFMKDNEWTIADDPGFFTVLTDNWLYNINVYRLSGKRITFSITPSYRNFFDKYRLNDMEPELRHTNTFGAVLGMEFEKYKPQNVHHDIFRTHELSVGMRRDVRDNGEGNMGQNTLVASVSTAIGHQWIPNSRTLLTASFNVNGDFYESFESDDALADENLFVGTSLKSTANYFISYRTRFFAQFEMSYYYNTNAEYTLINIFPVEVVALNTGFHVFLNGGITVSIF